MKKQIILTRDKKETDIEIAKNLFNVLSLFNIAKSKWNCYFDLNQSENDVLNEVKQIHGCEIKTITEKDRPITKKPFNRISLSVFNENLIDLILIAVKKDLNILISSDNVLLIINDNDGDFIVFDTKKYKHKEVEEKIKIIV